MINNRGLTYPQKLLSFSYFGLKCIDCDSDTNSFVIFTQTGSYDHIECSSCPYVLNITRPSKLTANDIQRDFKRPKDNPYWSKWWAKLRMRYLLWRHKRNFQPYSMPLGSAIVINTKDFNIDDINNMIDDIVYD